VELLRRPTADGRGINIGCAAQNLIRDTRIVLFIGLIFSLGSTSVIGNLISGYSLTYRRVFRVGDRVKIGDYIGYVQESKLMVTYLHTVKNEVVAVPNSQIIIRR
jgi:small-conductance mechanosensitive channel